MKAGTSVIVYMIAFNPHTILITSDKQVGEGSWLQVGKKWNTSCVNCEHSSDEPQKLAEPHRADKQTFD